MSCNRHAARCVAVMLHVWYTIAFQFDSHLGDIPFLFFYIFQNFPKFTLKCLVWVRVSVRVSIRVNVRVSIRVSVGVIFRVSVRVSVRATVRVKAKVRLRVYLLIMFTSFLPSLLPPASWR